MPRRRDVLVGAVVAGSVAWVARARVPRRATRASVLPLAPQRILVVKLADLGDAIGIEPALASLRHAFPHATLDALVSPAASLALASCPHLDQIIDFDKQAYDRPSGALAPARATAVAALLSDLRSRRYDLVVVLHHLSTHWGALKFEAVVRSTGAPFVAGLENGRGHFLTHAAVDLGFGFCPEWRYWLDVVRVIGVTPVDRLPRFWVPADDQARADARLASLVPDGDGGGPVVALHAGVGRYAPIKQWPIERLATVGRRLHADTQATLLVVGGPDMAALGGELAGMIGPGAFDLTGQTSLPELAGLLRRCALVIGNDSGVVHLASAVDTPSLTIFGPTNALAWAPADAEVRSLTEPAKPSSKQRPKSVALLRGEPCSPCHYVGFSVRSRLPCAHRNCLQRLASDDVYRQARALLAND
jgi:ADP-heptose:LPS heptosyltransferase